MKKANNKWVLERKPKTAGMSSLLFIILSGKKQFMLFNILLHHSKKSPLSRPKHLPPIHLL